LYKHHKLAPKLDLNIILAGLGVAAIVPRRTEFTESVITSSSITELISKAFWNFGDIMTARTIISAVSFGLLVFKPFKPRQLPTANR
jgi:hypothetical protein